MQLLLLLAERRIVGLELQRVAVVLVLLELLQLFDVEERVEVVLDVGDLADVDGAVAVDEAGAVAAAVMHQTAAVARRAHVATAAAVACRRLPRLHTERHVGCHSATVSHAALGNSRSTRLDKDARAADGGQVLVVGLLVLADEAAYVVHLVASLRVVERVVRMGDVDVYEVGEEEAETGYARQLAVHVYVAYLALVVARVEHEVGEAVELGRVALRHVLRPRLLEPEDGRRLERHHNGHERVERVELVETLGHLDEVREHLAALLDAQAVEYLLLAPEGGLIEAAREVHYVGRAHQLVARHPLAADELVGLDRLEQRQVDERQLAGQIVRIDAQYVEDHVVERLVGVVRRAVDARTTGADQVRRAVDAHMLLLLLLLLLVLVLQLLLVVGRRLRAID